jgi:arsenate reductase-like glutaredoxin family protein
VEIEDLLKDKAASEMFNFRSPSFAKLGLDRDKLTDEELIELMLKEPRLVRRPVVQIDGSVYFGADAKALKVLIG